MELILMRHGQAEEQGDHSNDQDRELTKEGKKKVLKTAKALKRYLPKYSHLYIWSSPLIRALQTATILAEILGKDDIDVFECIGSGDLETLATEWSKLDEDNICLIVVGHEPYLSNWSRQICGLSLPFKKGSSAGIKLLSTNHPSGKLQWFIQAEILEHQKNSQGKS